MLKTYILLYDFVKEHNYPTVSTDGSIFRVLEKLTHNVFLDTLGIQLDNDGNLIYDGNDVSKINLK